MKKALILFACLLGLSLSARAQQNTALPQGTMSVNAWTGSLKVGGVTVDPNSLDQYFAEPDLSTYKSGKTLCNVGNLMVGLGAIPFAYGTGSSFRWWNFPEGTVEAQKKKTAQICMWTGLGISVVGLAISISGSSKMKKAIRNYNASLAYQPELHWGATENGLGLAFVF